MRETADLSNLIRTLVPAAVISTLLQDIYLRHEAAAHEHPELFRQMVTVHVRSRNFYGIPWNLTELFVAYDKIVHLLHRVHNMHNDTHPVLGRKQRR